MIASEIRDRVVAAVARVYPDVSVEVTDPTTLEAAFAFFTPRRAGAATVELIVSSAGSYTLIVGSTMTADAVQLDEPEDAAAKHITDEILEAAADGIARPGFSGRLMGHYGEAPWAAP